MQRDQVLAILTKHQEAIKNYGTQVASYKLWRCQLANC
ncbi:hypothetical protein MiSe_57530 [Microseira wollei NIES-4236]|uniref:Transposase n=1 Tax=Microseira wollei NIES-4236 TaxID=2530354 RepID=A0AAV3XHD4_9CYAN|nr:hypothetical protein MiSe_57530 [Microseira wollei NIES-4236]